MIIKSSFLKKLISRKNISAILTELAARLGTRFSVIDMDGNVLAGFGSDKFAHKHNEIAASHSHLCPAQKAALYANTQPKISRNDSLEENKGASPINIERETVGFVKGGGKADSVFSEVVNYIVGNEYDKRNLSGELLSKYREINLFYDFAENINIRKDFNDMALSTSTQISELIAADSIMIILKGEYTGELEVVYEFGRARAKDARLEAADAVIPGRVLASGRAEIVNDLSSDSGFSCMSANITGSAMCVPLKIQDRIIGAVYLTKEEPITYTSENLKLLTVFSSQVAAFIENDRLFQNLQETFISTVYTLAETIEARDNYTGDHTKRVMDYSIAMGGNLGMAADELETLRLSAVLHDIGKIGIRDSVLLKPGRLSDDEFEIIKTHAVLGEKILNNIKQLKHIIPGVK